jgi:hypothetical protein
MWRSLIWGSALTLGLAGCGGAATISAASSPSVARTKTVSSELFRFSIVYDNARLRETVDKSIGGPHVTVFLPGVGQVTGSLLVVDLTDRNAFDRPTSKRGALSVSALRVTLAVRTPSLAQVRKAGEPTVRGLTYSGLAQQTSIDGLPAFRVRAEWSGVRIVNYTVYAGRLIYLINLEAPNGRWASLRPTFDAAVNSFKRSS